MKDRDIMHVMDWNKSWTFDYNKYNLLYVYIDNHATRVETFGKEHWMWRFIWNIALYT